MKILFAGSLAAGQTSQMRMEVLRELGHSIIPIDTYEGWRRASMISRRLQQHLCIGPIIEKINRDVIALARQHGPDLFWGEKQEYLYPKTIEELRRLKVNSLHFTPDPYFSLSWKRTRLMDAGIALFDYVVTSKRYEIGEYEKICKKVIYVPLGFAEEVHRPVEAREPALQEGFRSDVSFVGGWEPRREQLLDAIARKTGCNLKIWGYGWDHLIDGRWTLRRWQAMRRNAGGERFKIRKNQLLGKSVQGGEIYGDSYAFALSGARIGIGFLRQICHDQHTTRTFEIPACASMLIADRTPEHRALFVEGEEAEFFSSQEELLDKVNYYLNNEKMRERIALKGYLKCHQAGYSYKYRLTEILGKL